MPPERKRMGQSTKGSIRIAKPEMTLHGFQHTNQNLIKKRRNDEQLQMENDAMNAPHSMGGTQSHLSKATRSDINNQSDFKMSERGSRNADLLQHMSENQDLEGNGEDIVFMDENLQGNEDAQHNAQMQQQQDEGSTTCIMALKNGATIDELNPRNYAYVPSCWTKRIIPAGKYTVKSDNIGSVLHGAN